MNNKHTQTVFVLVSQAWLLWVWVNIQPTIVHLSACRLSGQMVPAGLETQIGQAWMSLWWQVGPTIGFRDAHWHRRSRLRAAQLGRNGLSWAMCVPTLTNWIKPPVDRKGSASVRPTYKDDWHSGVEWAEGGRGEGGREQMCVPSPPWHHAEGEEALLTLIATSRQMHTCMEECVCGGTFYNKAKKYLPGCNILHIHNGCLGMLFILYLITSSRVINQFICVSASITSYEKWLENHILPAEHAVSG